MAYPPPRHYFSPARGRYRTQIRNKILKLPVFGLPKIEALNIFLPPLYCSSALKNIGVTGLRALLEIEALSSKLFEYMYMTRLDEGTTWSIGSFLS